MSIRNEPETLGRLYAHKPEITDFYVALYADFPQQQSVIAYEVEFIAQLALRQAY